jgi:hypothetical protein
MNGEKTYPDGYCHFPERDSEYFKSLVSEKLVRITDKKGQIKYYWQKTATPATKHSIAVYMPVLPQKYSVSATSAKSTGKACI